MTSLTSFSTARTRAGAAILVVAAVATVLLLLLFGRTDASASAAAPPFPGPQPVAIPGVFEAENYDTGGPGVSFNDTDSVNRGGQYRNDAVDIWPTYLDPGGYTVGHTRAGEWLTYSISIAEAGQYRISPRVATGSANPGGLTFRLNDQTPQAELLGSLDIDNTGGWWNWQNPKLFADLPAGSHTISVEWTGGGQINLDRIVIVVAVVEPDVRPYPGPDAPVVPGVIEAENYDRGGEGVAYSDKDVANVGGQYRSDAVDIWPTYGDPGGYTLGRTQNREWVEYTVEATEAGVYAMSPRIASGSANPGDILFRVAENPFLTIDVDYTGGWWSWRDPEVEVSLRAGRNVIRMLFINGGEINVDNISLRKIPDDPSAGGVVTVWARGDEGGETFNLKIDGRTIATRTVNTVLTGYRVQVDALPTADSVRVEFTNDLYDRQQGFDRNLFVDKISFENSDFETEDFETEDASVYSTGVWRREDGIRPGFGRGEKLAANGYFQYASRPTAPTPIPPTPVPPTPIPPTPIPPTPTPITAVTVELSDIAGDPDANVADNIQAALNRLDDAGGTVTVTGDGDYPWRSKVIVKSNQRLIVDSTVEFDAMRSLDHMIEFANGTKSAITQAVVEGGTWDSNARVAGALFDITGATDGVVVQKARFHNTGGEAASGGPRGIAIQISGVGENSRMIRVADNTFSNFFQMVRAKDVTGLFVEDNIFWNLLDTLPVSAIVDTIVTDADGRMIPGDNGQPQPLRYLAGANGGSFVYLDGSTHHVSIKGNSNPGAGRWAYRTTEVGGHVISVVPGQPHSHLSITDNHFVSVPRTAWSTVQPNPYRDPADPAEIETPKKEPVPNGASGDVITVKNVEFFEVLRNRVDGSGEFSITAVHGSSNGIIANNEVYGSDGGAIVIGASSAVGAVNRRVTDIEVRDNIIANIGLDNAGDLQPGPPADRRGLQANYPNTRTGIRIWSASRINVRSNDIRYNSSGIWLKVTDFNAAVTEELNRVRDIHIPTDSQEANRFEASSDVWSGKSKVRNASGDPHTPAEVDASNDPTVHQIVPQPELGLFESSPSAHVIATSPFLPPEFGWLN